jgi:hypothetical protein
MVKSNWSSICISHSQARAVREAAVFAFCIQQPLNRFITIHLGQHGSDDPQATIGVFLKRACDWIRKRSGLAPIYVWVLENPVGGGLNAHILLRLPPMLAKDFNRLKAGWLSGPGNTASNGVFHSKAVHHSGPSASTEVYLHHGLLGVLRYMLKGIEPSAGPAFGITPVLQGRTLGKRSGHSEALGAQHRWKRIPYAEKPGISVGAPSVVMRRVVLHACPELLGQAE